MANARSGVGVTYVLARADDDANDLPVVLGFHAQHGANGISFGSTGHQNETSAVPFAGGTYREACTAAHAIGCVGTILDALDAEAESFYRKYGFTTVTDESWPRRMFLPLAVAAKLFET